MKWVVTITVTPLRARPLIWVQNSRRVMGSTPEVGSSRNSTGGRCITAQASARRCLTPSGRDSGAADSQGCSPKMRSEEHTSELQSLMRISYAVFCLKKKKKHQQ